MSTSVARRVTAIAIVVGALAEILFGRSIVGINVIILAAAILAAALVVRRTSACLDPADRWLPVATLAFAAFLALRADPLLVLADLAIAAALLGASLVALGGARVTRGTFLGALDLGVRLAFASAAGSASVLREAQVGPPTSLVPTGTRTRYGPVVRGLLFGLPLFVLFAVLFASADAVFGGWMESVLSIRIDLGELPGRAMFAGAVAWLVGGALWAVAHDVGRWAPTSSVATRSLGAASAVPNPPAVGLRLPSAEVVTMLAGLNALFAVFVVLQLAYLFGGFDTLAATGLTYAEYARRGFFELVVAASIVGLLVVGLEATIVRRTRGYVAMLVALMGLTAIVLGSAFVRLRLYQEAYGWTELRFYALAMMGFLAVGLVFAVGLVVSARSRWLPHALVVAGLVVSVVVNVVGPQAFVTARNLERAIDPSLVPPGGEVALDADYLARLGDGAIPVVVDALPRLPSAERTALLEVLEEEYARLRTRESARGWPAWNVDRERARAALEGLFGGS
ncbi:MAG TPA: DUF4173 domain-containing protein [Candidatus Limnocylindrales bacterium]|nr:DUF4173 domain-containing protein [Candidatus Limnocylindrales bacterium]